MSEMIEIRLIVFRNRLYMPSVHTMPTIKMLKHIKGILNIRKTNIKMMVKPARDNRDIFQNPIDNAKYWYRQANITPKSISLDKEENQIIMHIFDLK